MRSRIARKLMLCFAAALFLFSVVIGVLFIILFRAQTITEHKNNLELRAVSIAGALSDYLGSESTGFGKATAGGGKGAGFGAYLRFIDEIAMSDFWIVDEELNLIVQRQMPGVSYHYTDLPQDAEQVVKEVFSGKTTFSESFGSLLNAATLTVGTPIEVGGRIVGAVLLHSPVEGIDDATMRGVGIMAVSILAAVALSAILSGFFALAFTKPLNQMKNSALLLAEGDYTAKTKVRQKDEIGELAGAIDILSERLLVAKRESDRLDKLRREFVANISHELRTPVTVIRGSLEALCDEVVTDPEQILSYHRQMLGESLFLQRLIDDLLDLSRLQNVDFKMDRQPVNLCDVTSDAVRSAGHLAREKGIVIRQESDTQGLTVMGDYGRLRQMLLIVLDNAVKFSPADSEIALSLNRGVISICDQGSGIAEEDLPHIFDRFYKIQSEENKSGSGLGLAIAKQIADRHQIKITAANLPSGGVKFEFRFSSDNPATPRLAKDV